MGQKTRGITIGYADTSGGTYTAIASIIDLPSGPKISVDKVDATVSDSPSEYRQRDPGWKDVGDIAAKIQFAKAAQATILALVGVAKFWKITYPDGSAWGFAGFISEFGNSHAMTGNIEADIGIAVNGVPTFTPAA